MYKIINRHVYEMASGENITLCDIVADTANDLPDAGDIALYKIAFGSFAYVIDEGVFYSLDSSGTWNGGAYSEVITEVVTARGSFSSLDARLDDMDVILNSAKLGVKYKGAVNYYNDLPSTGNEIGDAYTVKYAGSSGTTPDGTEYVWGELGGVAQWIDFSKDCYTKAEIDTILTGKQDVLDPTQLAAVNSGIDSAKVMQIETNKNNIALIKHAANTSIYIQETTPAGVIGDYWISAANGVKTYTSSGVPFDISTDLQSAYLVETPSTCEYWTTTSVSRTLVIPCNPNAQYIISVNSKTLRCAIYNTVPVNNSSSTAYAIDNLTEYSDHSVTVQSPNDGVYLAVNCYLSNVESADGKTLNDIFDTLTITEKKWS